MKKKKLCYHKYDYEPVGVWSSFYVRRHCVKCQKMWMWDGSYWIELQSKRDSANITPVAKRKDWEYIGENK